jgi:uncharacterized protein YchJ
MNRSDRRAHDARPCYCDSGKKYRNCHAIIERETIATMAEQAAVVAAQLPRSDWAPYNPRAS